MLNHLSHPALSDSDLIFFLIKQPDKFSKASTEHQLTRFWDKECLGRSWREKNLECSFSNDFFQPDKKSFDQDLPSLTNKRQWAEALENKPFFISQEPSHIKPGGRRSPMVSVLASHPAAQFRILAEIFSHYCSVCGQYWDQTHLLLKASAAKA